MQYASADDVISPAPAFDANALLELPTSNWLTNGGNIYNQRYFTTAPDQSQQRRESKERCGVQDSMALAQM